MAPEHHGDADPNAPPAPPTPLQAWEQRMQRAQALWQNGEQEFALAQLVQAIPLAHQLLRSPYLTVQPDDYLAAWVVTHLWIAELLAERQQLPAALDYLCDAHTALLGLGDSTEVSLLQQAAWRHQRETVQALLQWQRLLMQVLLAEQLRQMNTTVAGNGGIRPQGPLLHGQCLAVEWQGFFPALGSLQQFRQRESHLGRERMLRPQG